MNRDHTQDLTITVTQALIAEPLTISEPKHWWHLLRAATIWHIWIARRNARRKSLLPGKTYPVCCHKTEHLEATPTVPDPFVGETTTTPTKSFRKTKAPEKQLVFYQLDLDFLFPLFPVITGPDSHSVQSWVFPQAVLHLTFLWE